MVARAFLTYTEASQPAGMVGVPSACSPRQSRHICACGRPWGEAAALAPPPAASVCPEDRPGLLCPWPCSWQSPTLPGPVWIPPGNGCPVVDRSGGREVRPEVAKSPHAPMVPMGQCVHHLAYDSDAVLKGERFQPSVTLSSLWPCCPLMNVNWQDFRMVLRPPHSKISRPLSHSTTAALWAPSGHKGPQS